MLIVGGYSINFSIVAPTAVVNNLRYLFTILLKTCGQPTNNYVNNSEIINRWTGGVGRMWITVCVIKLIF